MAISNVIINVGMNGAEKTAILLGATGLVGSSLLQLLLADDRYSKVLVFHRRKTGVSHPKLEEHIVKFHEMVIWKHFVIGDHLYSALGTTLKTAGSKKAQYTVDYDYQYEMALTASKNGIKGYCLVSSAGASARSKNFYQNMKGHLDRDVQKLNFDKTVILRPSFLKGNRNESRIGEKIGIPAFDVLSFIPPLKKYRPIPAHSVAKAMITALNNDSPKIIYESEEIFDLV